MGYMLGWKTVAGFGTFSAKITSEYLVEKLKSLFLLPQKGNTFSCLAQLVRVPDVRD